MLRIIVLFSNLNLLKQLLNSSLSDSGILVLVVCIKFVLVRSFHCKCFTTTSLTISKYCCVITLNHLGYKTRDAQPLVHIRLLVLGREYLVEVVYLPPIHL